MTDLEIIEAEIDRLEAKDTSYYTCSRLATLYTVRDHLKSAGSSTMTTTTLVPRMEGSDFLKAASGKRVEDVMKVVDEHLETIRMLYPKTFDGVVERVKQLG